VVGQGKESVRHKIRPSKSFGGEAQAGGQKGRGLGGRNFCPPASVPVPFEKRKSGRGVWGEFRFSFAKSNCGQPRHLPEYLEGRTPQKNTLSLEEKEIGRAQNEKSKEYFSVVWRACRAMAGLASLVGGLLKECSNFVQKTPPDYQVRTTYFIVVRTW